MISQLCVVVGILSIHDDLELVGEASDGARAHLHQDQS